MMRCMPQIPDQKICDEILAQLPEPVAAHSREVWKVAMEMTDLLAEQGVQLQRELICAAALLHDLCRTAPQHAAAGAQKLQELGYNEVADIVAVHHDWDDNVLDERAIVFLADKYVLGTERVTLEKRFENSARKCKDLQAQRAHIARYQAACRAERLYRQMLMEENTEKDAGGRP